MRWRTTAAARAAGLLLAIALAAGTQAMQPAPARADDGVLVGVDAVRSEPMLQTTPIIGRLVALRRGVVSVREPGIIAEMRAEVGDRVTAGTVLARLRSDRLAADRALREAEIEASRSALASAEAERRLRQQELARIEGLRRSPAYSESRFEDQREQLAMATGRVAEAAAAEARARAQLRLAEIALADAEIRAPYDGVVTQKMTEVGAHVAVGDPVVALIDDGALEIEADVPEDRIAGLTTGRSIDFDLGGRRLQARLRAVVPDENPLTRTRTVRLVPDFAEVTDRAANRSVILMVPLDAQRTAATVHKDAVLHDGGVTYVMRVLADRAERRPVRLGEAIGSRFEVIDGLVPGDVVVTRGNERLQSGQKVRSRAGGTTG
jgi:RND family efflux transporter MFP subunit